MSFNKVAQIARREFLARVRSRAFIFTTLLVPGMFVLWGGISVLFTRTDISQLRLAVLDFGTGLGGKLAERLAGIEDLPITIEQTVNVAAADQERVRRQMSDAVRNEQLEGYLVLRPDVEIRARAQYYARETGNPVILGNLDRAVTATVLESWLSGDELEKVRQVQGADLETITVSKEGEESGGFLTAYISTFALAMLMYMMVMMHGQQMAMAIVEEKSSRLIELIIGAVTAVEFMAGKILGVLGAGLAQLGIWIVMALVVGLYALPGLMVASSFMTEVDLGKFLDPGLATYFLIFLVLGYLMYVTLFSAVGATCNSTEELQHAMFPVMLPIMLAFFSTFYVITNPSSLATRVLSFIPFFTPLVMFARVNVAEPPLWEVWLGIVILIVGVVFSVWAAAKIFRVAILMHGKRPALVDLWRMVRTD
ncbi:MAG: ABC transporter permease [Acidobacteriota bacterium]